MRFRRSLSDGLVEQHSVDAADSVDELRHTQVYDGARERQRVLPGKAELARHQVEHSVQRLRCGFVEIFAETEGDPGFRSVGVRGVELKVVPNYVAQVCSLYRTLDACSAHLAVALRSVTVTDGDERARDGDGEIERTPGGELLAVEVAAGTSWWPGRVPAGHPWGESPIVPRKGRSLTL